MSSNEPFSSSSASASSSTAVSSSVVSRSASSDNPDELTPVESSHYRDGPGNLLAVVSMGAEEGEEEMVKVVVEAEAAIDDATSCAAVFEGFRGTAAANVSADRFVQCLRNQEALPWPSMRLQSLEGRCLESRQ